MPKLRLLVTIFCCLLISFVNTNQAQHFVRPDLVQKLFDTYGIPGFAQA